MKKLIFAFAVGLISTLAITDGLNAQNQNSSAMLTAKEGISMENAAPAGPANSKSAVANARAAKNFSKAYKNVHNETWVKIQDGYAASFTLGEIRTVIYFNNRGNWVGSLKGYTEDKLSKDIRTEVKRTYFDHDITYVQEIETLDTNNQPVYLVHLQDATSIIIVRVNDGEMSVYKEYQKQ